MEWKIGVVLVEKVKRTSEGIVTGRCGKVKRIIRREYIRKKEEIVGGWQRKLKCLSRVGDMKEDGVENTMWESSWNCCNDGGG
jgi:hypothetical protein